MELTLIEYDPLRQIVGEVAESGHTPCMPDFLQRRICCLQQGLERQRSCMVIAQGNQVRAGHEADTGCGMIQV